MGKIFKYLVYSMFFGMLVWLGVHMLNMFFVFPDWRIQTLCISVVTFIIIIALKRGVFH